MCELDFLSREYPGIELKSSAVKNSVLTSKLSSRPQSKFLKHLF